MGKARFLGFGLAALAYACCGPRLGQAFEMPAAAQAPIERLFSAPNVETRALLVVAGGKAVSERYAPGFDAETRFVSWSMAKSVLAIALGMLVDEGRLALDAPAPVAAWAKPGDPRGTITLRQLLNMSAGLEHQEGGVGGKPVELADTVRLLFTDAAQDSAAFAASQPVKHAPGTVWQYSTATSQILSGLVADAIAGSADADARRRLTVAWFQTRLFEPLDIASAEWDFDSAGTFHGGSLLHMTARDWAKLGQFMLAGGKALGGRRLLSEAWLAVMTAKSPAANNAHYGGHVWLNTGPGPKQQAVLFHPRGGADIYSMMATSGNM